MIFFVIVIPRAFTFISFMFVYLCLVYISHFKFVEYFRQITNYFIFHLLFSLLYYHLKRLTVSHLFG